MKRIKSIMTLALLLLALAAPTWSALVLPNEGEIQALKGVLGYEQLVLKLYVSNSTPAETDTVATYTEASGSGYASMSLTYSSWGYTGGNPTVALYPQVTFTFSGQMSGLVYGYYVVGGTSGKLYWAERFKADDGTTDAPFAVSHSGDVLKFTPRFTLE